MTLAPVFRMPTEWDKATLKARRMPQGYATDVAISDDGTLALASGGRGVARHSLADGSLEGFWSSGQAFALAASLSRDGTLSAVVKKGREGRLARVPAAGGKPEVTVLGDLVSWALPPDEVLELSVWELPLSAKPRRVLRRLLPARDATHGPSYLLVDAVSGRVEATWKAAGSFLDEELVVGGMVYRAWVARGATGEVIAWAQFPHYIRAFAAPGGRVVTVAAPGNDPAARWRSSRCVDPGRSERGGLSAARRAPPARPAVPSRRGPRSPPP